MAQPRIILDDQTAKPRVALFNANGELPFDVFTGKFRFIRKGARFSPLASDYFAKVESGGGTVVDKQFTNALLVELEQMGIYDDAVCVVGPRLGNTLRPDSGDLYVSRAWDASPAEEDWSQPTEVEQPQLTDGVWLFDGTDMRLVRGTSLDLNDFTAIVRASIDQLSIDYGALFGLNSTQYWSASTPSRYRMNINNEGMAAMDFPSSTFPTGMFQNHTLRRSGNDVDGRSDGVHSLESLEYAGAWAPAFLFAYRIGSSMDGAGSTALVFSTALSDGQIDALHEFLNT